MSTYNMHFHGKKEKNICFILSFLYSCVWINIFLIFIPPANCVCEADYAVFMLSVHLFVHPSLCHLSIMFRSLLGVSKKQCLIAVSCFTKKFGGFIKAILMSTNYMFSRQTCITICRLRVCTVWYWVFTVCHLVNTFYIKTHQILYKHCKEFRNLSAHN